MLNFKFLFFAGLLSINILSTSHVIAAEGSLISSIQPNEGVKLMAPFSVKDAIPSEYQHYRAAQQIGRYREIFDGALSHYGNTEALKTEPIPGLFRVLENAFALANDFINGKFETDSSELQPDETKVKQKEKYLEVLRDLWARAKKFEDQLTSSLFQGFNKNLTHIIDSYKEKWDINRDNMAYNNPLAFSKLPDSNINDVIFIIYGFPKPGKARNLSPFRFVEQFFHDQYPSYLSFFDVLSRRPGWDLHLIKGNIDDGFLDPTQTPAISSEKFADTTIYTLWYTKKDGDLAHITLNEETGAIDQLFKGENFKSKVFLWDSGEGEHRILKQELEKMITGNEGRISAPKGRESTKKDPHWSDVSGTDLLLRHDLGHNMSQIRFINQESKGHLKEVYNLYKKFKASNRNNDATILIDALFMIIHEIPYNVNTALDTDITTFFKNISSQFINQMTFTKQYALAPYGSKTYKVGNRDWEFILKDKFVDKDGMIKPVHDEQGPFLPIEYNPELGKMTRPFKDEPERSAKMTEALEKGYARFWQNFAHLVLASSQ